MLIIHSEDAHHIEGLFVRSLCILCVFSCVCVFVRVFLRIFFVFAVHFVCSVVCLLYEFCLFCARFVHIFVRVPFVFLYVGMFSVRYVL